MNGRNLGVVFGRKLLLVLFHLVDDRLSELI
jgi:hypothetical protein